MSANLYDKALLLKIKNWIKDDKMTITGPDETKRLFEYTADINNDKPIELPLIALRRSPTVTLDYTNKRPITFDGAKITADANSKKIARLNAIGMILNYTLDIYTRYFEESEEYVRNFVFNFINYPKLNIEIPYNNSKLIHQSRVSIGQNIEDNSNIPERLIPGQFTRKTISLFIDDAYFFDYVIKDTKTIETEVSVELAEDVKKEN